MVVSVDDLLTQYRDGLDMLLECLTQVTQRSCWLPQKHPAHGAKLHWQDKVHQDMKKYGISELSRRVIWYTKAQGLTRWSIIDSINTWWHHLQTNHLYVPPTIDLFEGDTRYVCQGKNISPPVLDNNKRCVTTYSGEHHLVMAGFKYKFKLKCMCVCVYVCVCVCICMCVYLYSG